MQRHYHVIYGNPGRLPDSNELFTNKQPAARYLATQVQDWRDAYGEQWTGSAQSGLYTRSDGMYYAEITECTESTDNCTTEES